MRSGVLYMFVATFFFAIMNVLVKLLPDIPSIEIVFFRSVVSLVITLVMLRGKGIKVLGTQKKWLIARGTVGAIALVLYFYMVQKIPLASAVTLQFLSPIFTAILGMIMLKERIKPIQWGFFLISFIGVVVVQGLDQRITVEFLLIGLVAGVFSGLAYNIIRKIGTNEHPLVIVLYFPLVTMPITGSISIFQWVTPTAYQLILLLSIGVVVQVAQYCMTVAYQKEEVNKIAPIKYFSIVYALTFGWLVFEESYPYTTYIGMALVVAGVLLNLRYKQKQVT